MGYPKILHDNRLDDATPVASTTATGYNVLNLRDWRPYTWWKPTALPATVTVDSAVASAADYALIFGHSLHTAQAAVEVRGSTDNFVSSDVLLATSNLMSYPEQFDNASWTKGDSTITANAALAPDGTFTADKLVEAATTAQHYVAKSFATPANDINTVSIYVKAAGRTECRLVQVDPTINNVLVVINLTTGALIEFGSSGTVASADYSITDAGNGWWRISVTAAHAATSTGLQIQPMTNSGLDSVYLGDTTKGIYIWAGQLKHGAAAGYYEGIDNGPLYLPFSASSYRYYRLRVVQLSGSTMPSLAIAAIGSALEVPSYMSSGFDPLGRKVVGQSNRSEGGQPLGRVIDYEEWRENLRFENVSWSWLRNSFNPAWAAHLRSEPFGFCWDAASYADEVRLVQSGADYKTPHRPGALADLSLEVFGVI